MLVALLAIGGLYASLPTKLLPFTDTRMRWIPMVIVLLTAAPLMLSHRQHRHRLNTILAYVLLAILTCFMLASLALLVLGLKGQKETPSELLKSAAGLWATNVLVFACWYWRLDAGGPHARAARLQHHEGAFLFPQMSMSPEQLEKTGQEGWKPGFIDYLFLAYNSSAALSPTDAPVLSRWAKGLMMVQASISLSIIVLLVGRAVNIIGSTPPPPPVVVAHSSSHPAP
ncbi:hypothetical protein OP10G_3334 [Fimbriimonas ginsengisoli Gsoil 348]|uniref:DUF1345 domain-containing protein n=1 Tax=Fimbriimonas ginsengisoli Gsoil 348 TaxID=661478 RepID=A0A068NTM0_FIMGI|nr:hypothetical protein OP10G_3334 [Fimbriimonas ginsengisoli Gsoil 348]